MQIQKLVSFLILLLFGCYTKKNETHLLKEEKNVVEDFLDETILDREDFGLMGNVQSTLEYEFKSGELNDEILNIKEGKYHFISTDSTITKIRNVEIRESYSLLFNESGRVIKKIRYVNYDKIYMEIIEKYTFDNSGKLIEWSKTDFDNELTAQKTFTYDKQARLVEFMESYPFDKSIRKVNTIYKKDTITLEITNSLRGGITSPNRVKYDKYGDIIEDNPREREGKEYDENGNLIKSNHEGLNGFYSPFSIIYDYDYKGNKIKETEYDSINNIVSTERYYYNKENKLVQSIEIDTLGTEINRYDENKYVYEYTWTPFKDNKNGSFYSFWRNYDKYGNVIKRVDLHRENNGKMIEDITKTELEYDEFGNWISKSVFENDSLTTLYEREIRYF